MWFPYRFSHDKVREASYGLIPERERSTFHHNIGMLLYYATQGQDIDSIVFLMVDQINHGSIEDYQERVNIAELNHRAASIAMGNSNFSAAYFYSCAAKKLLPQGHWEGQYELSLKIFLVMGNSSYADGHISEATR